jgi:hypothetical protein
MIVLYIYIALALTWGIYNAIVETPKYLKMTNQEHIGGTERTAMYIVNIIVGTLLAPLSFYQKIVVRKRVKQDESKKLDK